MMRAARETGASESVGGRLGGRVGVSESERRRAGKHRCRAMIEVRGLVCVVGLGVQVLLLGGAGDGWEAAYGVVFFPTWISAAVCLYLSAVISLKKWKAGAPDVSHVTDAIAAVVVAAPVLLQLAFVCAKLDAGSGGASWFTILLPTWISLSLLILVLARL